MATIIHRGPLQYQATIRRRGYPSQSKTFETKAAAERWARDVESSMDKGRFVSAKEAESYTLAECLDRFQDEYFPRLKDPRREIARIRNLKKYPITKRIMSTIRAKDIADFRRTREAEGLKPDTIRLDFALISRVFNYARSDWGMESLSNPVQIVAKPKLPGGRTRRLVGDEEKRLLDACTPEFRTIVVLAIATAMRRSEIVGLRWENIDLKRHVIHLKETQNSTERIVPLNTHATEVLKQIPRNLSGKVFEIHADTIDGWMTKACKAAGIDGLRFHDLRHEATSRLFETTDLDNLEISEITGHKDLKTLKRYMHLRTDRLVARLNGARRGEIQK